MSPHIHSEHLRVRADEIARSLEHRHHLSERKAASRPRRPQMTGRVQVTLMRMRLIPRHA